MSNRLPIGYIRCLKCHRPALWLFHDIAYEPTDKDNVKILTNYTLDNIQYQYDPDIAQMFFCDSCHSEIDECNLSVQYMTFLKEVSKTLV